jgi:hypothetical protein
VEIKTPIAAAIIFFLMLNTIEAQALYQFGSGYTGGLSSSHENFVKVPDFEPLETKVNYPLLVGLGAANIGTFIAAHEYQAKTWWTLKPNVKFRAGWDGDYALYIDKQTHFLGAHFISHYVASNLEAADVETETAVWIGALSAFAYDMYIEVEDGTAEGFIFSYDDAIADVLGAGYFVAQYYFPLLTSIQPRISYYPSFNYRKKLTTENVLDDYEGQKLWVSFRMKELLPKSISIYWPKFLMLSVGTGIKNYYSNINKHREYFIGFDFDYSVIPLHGKFWEFVKNTLSYVHLPMPGIRISPKFAAFGFCY